MWESGNVYEGQYANDKRQGYGVMKWVDGTVYEGEWQFGAQHGHGNITFPNGDQKQGIFQNNVFKGQNYKQTNLLSLEEAKDQNYEDAPEIMRFGE